MGFPKTLGGGLLSGEDIVNEFVFMQKNIKEEFGMLKCDKMLYEE